MKEHRIHVGAKSVRGRTKRYIAAVIAIIMTFALSAVALADNDHSGTPGGQGDQKTQQPDGTDAQGSATRSQNGNHNQNGNNGNASDKMAGINVDKIEEAIAALTDEDAKASLTTLLSAYVAALEAKQDAIQNNTTTDLNELQAAIVAAKTALDTALEAAGISTDTIYGVPEDAEDGTGRMNNRPALNTDEILAAIAALDETDANKATLTNLLAAYQEALNAVNGADTTALTNEELEALNTALQNAETALLEASREAGLIGGLGRGQFVEGNAYGKAELDVATITERIAALGDTDANKATLATLLAAYEAALEAEAAADEGTLTNEQMQALQDTTKAAADALKEALEYAGIDAPKLQLQEEQKHEYQLSVVQSIAEENGTQSSVVDSFLNWLKSLFD